MSLRRSPTSRQTRPAIVPRVTIGGGVRPNKALHLTLCCSLGLLPQDRRSHESAAESGRYAAPKVISMFGGDLKLLVPPVLTSQTLATDG